MRSSGVFRVFAAIAIAASIGGQVGATDPTTTGIVAGLGLTAAGGKTTVTGTGGTIEAALLTSDAFLKAGTQIRRLAAVKARAKLKPGEPDPTILVLTHTDTLDFTMAHWVDWRLNDLIAREPPKAECKVSNDVIVHAVAQGQDVQAQLKAILPNIKFNTPTGTAQLAPSDLAAAIATDTSISGFNLTPDDRLLVDAVLMDSGHASWAPVADDPSGVATTRAQSTNDVAADFVVPGETIDIADPRAPLGHEPSLFSRFLDLERWAGNNGQCDSPRFKAFLAEVQTFTSSMTASDKGVPALATASEVLAVSIKNPYVLRLAIEQAGGSAITRSNIWYALGVIGAAKVSSGLLVSFRLSDPRSGANMLSGYVRCALSPTNFRDVQAVTSARVDKDGKLPPDISACSFVTS